MELTHFAVGNGALDDSTMRQSRLWDWGKYIMMQSVVPHTMDNSVKTIPALELITHFDDVTHRISWVTLLPWWRFMKAERWQGLSTTADGKTLYESSEVFAGLGAYILKWFLRTPLTKAFEAAAEALKARSEQLK